MLRILKVIKDYFFLPVKRQGTTTGFLMGVGIGARLPEPGCKGDAAINVGVSTDRVNSNGSGRVVSNFKLSPVK